MSTVIRAASDHVFIRLGENIDFQLVCLLSPNDKLHGWPTLSGRPSYNNCYQVS